MYSQFCPFTVPNRWSGQEDSRFLASTTCRHTIPRATYCRSVLSPHSNNLIAYAKTLCGNLPLSCRYYFLRWSAFGLDHGGPSRRFPGWIYPTKSIWQAGGDAKTSADSGATHHKRKINQRIRMRSYALQCGACFRSHQAQILLLQSHFVSRCLQNSTDNFSSKLLIIT